MARPLTPPALVFVGCPSLDQVVRDDRVRASTGGAAFISALAARFSGATTGLVARVPPTLPTDAAAAFGPNGIDRGGLICTTGSLPTFRIEYDEQDRATYTHVDNGLEHDLCAADLPEHWLGAEWIHIAAIGGDARQQLAVLRGLRERGYAGPISAGTYRRMVELDSASTRALLEQTQLFFLNEEEFDLLLPAGLDESHAGVVAITRGPEGIRVLGGSHAGDHPVESVEVVDATGAGDAFCGGFLAGLVTGAHPVESGVRAARLVLSGLGCSPLLQPVQSGVTARAELDDARIDAVARVLSEAASTSTLDFTDPPHLPADHPHALSMLCISTMHQYGFWRGDTSGWVEPMYAIIDGVRRKGSDYIWAAFSRAARTDPTLLDPRRMAVEPDLFERICTDDSGACPVPDVESHTALHMGHARAMLDAFGGDYARLVAEANDTAAPVQSLLDRLTHMPGYMSDPLLKKANLLAIILANRPEAFLDMRDPENVWPVVDYHLMRGCLRTGCVRILDPDLARRVDARAWVDGPEELAIRRASYRAIEALVERSGTTVAAVDGFFFVGGRTVCLETEAPRCESCPLEPVCGRLTDRFQPVFRTIAY